MNVLLLKLSRLSLFKSDLDYKLVRGAMAEAIRRLIEIGLEAEKKSAGQ
jgi:hypothetical protein